MQRALLAFFPNKFLFGFLSATIMYRRMLLRTPDVMHCQEGWLHIIRAKTKTWLARAVVLLCLVQVTYNADSRHCCRFGFNTHNLNVACGVKGGQTFIPYYTYLSSISDDLHHEILSKRSIFLIYSSSCQHQHDKQLNPFTM